MEKIVQHSAVTRKNLYVVGFGVLVFAILVATTIHKWIVLNIYQPWELFFECFLIFILIERAQSKYIYTLEKRALRINKISWLGNNEWVVSYKEILGVYRYKAKLIGVMKFRRTYRLHSALDGNTVWTLAYNFTKKNGKHENRRIYFKPNNELLAALHEKMPDKIMVPEEVVVLNDIKNEDEKSAD